MSKIINSFPYVVAQLIFHIVALAKSVSYDVWKYKPQHRYPIQVFMSRATL